jgi:hypothetical protein
MSHKVRKHSWINGILHFTDHLFEELEEALGFAKEQTDAHSVKVYDHQDQVTHELTPQNTSTYA